MQNPLTNYHQSVRSDQSGLYRFNNVPLNSYHLTVAAPGFAKNELDVNVKSPVPMTQDITLQLAGAETTTVEVTATSSTVLDLNPAAHNDVDQSILNTLPLTGTGLSDVISLSTPGVVADSNGFFHPQGDHAQTSYVVDGQPISDQQSRAFSTQMPENAFQNVEMITGSANAQYGDKTSLVVEASTQLGLAKSPFGELDANYGSFGTYGEKASLGFGGPKLGEFIVLDADRTGRFLDTPEFAPRHDIGNDGTIFDRIDFQPDQHDSFHLDLFGARNWFQIPNTYDQPNQDQRQKVVQFQYRARVPAHFRRYDAVHGEPVGAARFHELLPQPGPVRRYAGDHRAGPSPAELRGAGGRILRSGSAQFEDRDGDQANAPVRGFLAWGLRTRRSIRSA